MGSERWCCSRRSYRGCTCDSTVFSQVLQEQFVVSAYRTPFNTMLPPTGVCIACMQAELEAEWQPGTDNYDVSAVPGTEATSSQIPPPTPSWQAQAAPPPPPPPPMPTATVAISTPIQSVPLAANVQKKQIPRPGPNAPSPRDMMNNELAAKLQLRQSPSVTATQTSTNPLPRPNALSSSRDMMNNELMAKLQLRQSQRAPTMQTSTTTPAAADTGSTQEDFAALGAKLSKRQKHPGKSTTTASTVAAEENHGVLYNSDFDTIVTCAKPEQPYSSINKQSQQGGNPKRPAAALRLCGECQLEKSVGKVDETDSIWYCGDCWKQLALEDLDGVVPVVTTAPESESGHVVVKGLALGQRYVNVPVGAPGSTSTTEAATAGPSRVQLEAQWQPGVDDYDTSAGTGATESLVSIPNRTSSKLEQKVATSALNRDSPTMNQKTAGVAKKTLKRATDQRKSRAVRMSVVVAVEVRAC